MSKSKRIVFGTRGEWAKYADKRNDYSHNVQREFGCIGERK